MKRFYISALQVSDKKRHISIISAHFIINIGECCSSEHIRSAALASWRRTSAKTQLSHHATRMVLTVRTCHSVTLTDLKLVVTGRRETRTHIHSKTHSAAFRVITPRYARRQTCFLYKSAITGWKTARADGGGDPAVCSTNDEEDALTRSERQFGKGEVQTSAM